MLKSASVRYGTVAQFFHWLTAILVLVAFIYGPGGHEERVYSSAHEFDRRLHETLGLCVFALAIVRLIWRAIDTRPQAQPAPPWMERTAKTVQWALYLLLLALPLTAITGAWLEGHRLTLLGGVEIAPLFGASHDAGELIATIHTWLGDAIMWLAGLHALAALFHHVVLKDEVLTTMVPRWFPLGRSRTDR